MRRAGQDVEIRDELGPRDAEVGQIAHDVRSTAAVVHLDLESAAVRLGLSLDLLQRDRVDAHAMTERNALGYYGNVSDDRGPRVDLTSDSARVIVRDSCNHTITASVKLAVFVVVAVLLHDPEDGHDGQRH